MADASEARAESKGAASDASGADEREGFVGFFRREPYTVIFLVLCTIAGAVAAVTVPGIPESLSLFQKIFGGALAGAFFGMFGVVHRLY